MFCDPAPPLDRHGSEDGGPGGPQVVDSLRAEHPGPVAGLDDIEHVPLGNEHPHVSDDDHTVVVDLAGQLRECVETSLFLNYFERYNKLMEI